MIDWALAQLAGSAGHLFLQMDGTRMVRFGPFNMRGSEQRHDRSVKSSREVAGPTIGCNQQRGTPDQRLGQSKREGVICQRIDMRGQGFTDNLPGQVAFRWSAQYENAAAALLTQVAGQFSK